MELENFVFQVLAPDKKPVISIGMTRSAVERLKDAVIKTLERALEEGKIGVIALQLEGSGPGEQGGKTKNAYELLGGGMTESDRINLIEDVHSGWINFNAQTVLTVRKRPLEVSAFQAKVRLLIHTIDGIMAADPGDYIIKGIKGEFYPCKKEIFEQCYEVLSKE